MRYVVRVLILALIVFAQPAQARLPACTSAAERDAMAVRALQSFFMLAGVACNQADSYNRYMTRYQAQVAAHTEHLKGYFTRVYGRKGETHLNDFVTNLANAWSQVHLDGMNTYCKATWDILVQLEKMPAVDDAKMVRIAHTLARQKPVAAVLCQSDK